MRFLFGPVSREFADGPLAELRHAGECLAFGPQPGLDLQVGDNTTWGETAAQFPMGWRPDLIILHLPYGVVPAAIWSAPLPRVAWAAEAQLQWGCYRQVLRSCDAALIDSADVGRAEALGCRAVPMPMRQMPASPAVDDCAPAPRDIDLLFVGNLQAATQRERLPWLQRLADLSERWRVYLDSGVATDEYFTLLRRTKAVVDLSKPGHASRRILEAAASGALVLAPQSCAERLQELAEGVEWIAFEPAEFEVVAEAWLRDAAARERVARAGQAKARQSTFAAQWRSAEPLLRAALPSESKTVAADEALRLRSWQTLYSASLATPALAAEAARAAEAAADAEGSANWFCLAALLIAREERAPHADPGRSARLISWLRRAAAALPSHVGHQANLAAGLLLIRDPAAASQQARHALRLLERTAKAIDGGSAPPFPARYDAMRVESDQIAWRLDGQPDRQARALRRLQAWRLHSMLFELTGDVVHAYEAQRACPELPQANAALGLALARAGHSAAAAAPLRSAAALNPLDQLAARALHETLGQLGAFEEQEQLRGGRLRLHVAAPRLVPAEAWFSAAAPSASAPAGPSRPGLVSIIIPCCNGREDTEACVAALLAHAEEPFELVFVDNGSTDGTAEFVQRLRDDLGAERVRLHRSETQLGFPAACNCGAAQAQGELLLFLNNDTLVTSGWLASLRKPLADPQVGMTGPMSNHAPPPQEVPLGYADLSELEAFAQAHRNHFAGELAAIGRLSGFCLLIRRTLFESLGGFDARFGLGFFEDDDLCRRVREKGLKLMLVKEAYVHHHGGRTFSRLGLERERLLEEAKAKFIEKWGADAMAGYRPVQLAASPLAAQPRRRRVSLTMIVKNEENNLPDCLRSIRGLVDDIVVADTGSKDRTAEIAASFGARIVSFPWIDHFAAARNAALEQARGDYVLWLDADDRVDEENRARIKRLFAGLGPPRDAYAFKVRSALDVEARSVRLLDQVRLFPRKPKVRWEYRIHEQILPSVRRCGGEVRWTDVIVDHVGYVDPRVRADKLRRNIRLLRLDEAERPQDSFTLFNLGWTLLDLGETEEAILRLKRSLEHASPDSSILRKLYGLLTQAHRQAGLLKPALEFCRQGRCRCPDDLELPFEEALLLRDLGDLAGAERCLLQLLAIPERQFFASVDPELKAVRTRALLAELARRQGRFDDAARHAREGIAAQPKGSALWLEWGEACLAAKDWPALCRAAEGLAKAAKQPAEAEMLLARAERAQGDFVAARRRLERIISHRPAALAPRLLLSHVLLQEGKDFAAAESALREALRLDPENKEARRNLDILTSQRSVKD